MPSNRRIDTLPLVFKFKGRRTPRQARIESGEIKPDSIDIAAGEIRRAVEDIFNSIRTPRPKQLEEARNAE